MFISSRAELGYYWEVSKIWNWIFSISFSFFHRDLSEFYHLGFISIPASRYNYINESNNILCKLTLTQVDSSSTENMKWLTYALYQF